jgi:hypothetical protein
MVAAIRPLHVKELAEILAIRFDPDQALSLMEGWRPEYPEEAVLSACSTLIAIAENDGSKVVQFSHFSVKEYLTSDRLRTSEVGDICKYHIPLDAAHTILAQACLTVLLQLDEIVDKERLATFPLAFYAAQHWVDNAKFEDVALRIQDDMERLSNPRNPYLAAWVWIYDVDRGSVGALKNQHPSPTALYYASFCGFSGLANYIICTHGEDVNANSGYRGTPLHAASYKGHIDVVRVLLDHGTNVNSTDKGTPLYSAYCGGHLEIMRLLLEHGADMDVSQGLHEYMLHYASQFEQADIIHLLLRYNADVNARNFLDWTPLHQALFYERAKAVQLLLDHGADVNALSKGHNTPLHVALLKGSLEVVQLLLEHGADVDIRDELDRTPYQLAESGEQAEIVQLLLQHGAKKE